MSVPAYASVPAPSVTPTATSAPSLTVPVPSASASASATSDHSGAITPSYAMTQALAPGSTMAAQPLPKGANRSRSSSMEIKVNTADHTADLTMQVLESLPGTQMWKQSETRRELQMEGELQILASHIEGHEKPDSTLLHMGKLIMPLRKTQKIVQLGNVFAFFFDGETYRLVLHPGLDQAELASFAAQLASKADLEVRAATYSLLADLMATAKAQFCTLKEQSAKIWAESKEAARAVASGTVPVVKSAATDSAAAFQRYRSMSRADYKEVIAKADRDLTRSAKELNRDLERAAADVEPKLDRAISKVTGTVPDQRVFTASASDSSSSSTSSTTSSTTEVTAPIAASASAPPVVPRRGSTEAMAAAAADAAIQVVPAGAAVTSVSVSLAPSAASALAPIATPSPAITTHEPLVSA